MTDVALLKVGWYAGPWMNAYFVGIDMISLSVEELQRVR